MTSRDRSAESAISEIEEMVAEALWDFEAGDSLPSDFAKDLLARILRHMRLNNALEEFRRSGG